MVKALAVVAHHDDHVLWMGGTILQTAKYGWDWTLIAMCVPDKQRQEYYCHSVHGLGAKTNQAHYFDFADYQGPKAFLNNDRDSMSNGLVTRLENQTFDFVFTHSRAASREYGKHANHEEVELVVSTLIKEGKLLSQPINSSIGALAHFSYEPIYGFGGKSTVAKPKSSYYIQLNYDELIKKCRICNDAPDAHTSLKNIGYPCPNPEAFEGDGLQLPSPFLR